MGGSGTVKGVCLTKHSLMLHMPELSACRRMPALHAPISAAATMHQPPRQQMRPGSRQEAKRDPAGWPRLGWYVTPGPGILEVCPLNPKP